LHTLFWSRYYYVGWVIIIGAAITVGIIAAKGGDIAGKFAANQAYDFGTWLNNL
jgi:hypothetical protein